MDMGKGMIAVDFIAQELKRRNLSLYTFPGGTLAPLYDACHRAGVETIVARSEFGAGYAAIGAAKVTGKPQIVAVTSGPGATNLVTPIADAWYDRIPLIALTGQVATSNFMRDIDGWPTTVLGKVRQAGFQETPITSIVNCITRQAVLAKRGEALIAAFMSAINQPQDRWYGPVLIDMPMDSQREEVSDTISDRVRRDDIRPSAQKFSSLLRLLATSRKPVLLVGAGCRSAYDQLRRLVERTGIPVICSLPAMGVMPTDDASFFGMVGHTGHPAANMVVANADLVLALGSRLDVRQTGTETDAWTKDKKVVMVNDDLSELTYARVRVDLPIHARCEDVLEYLNNMAWPVSYDVWEKWHSKCVSYADDYPVADSQFARVIGEIDEQYNGDVIFVTGVGSHQQHAARHLALDYPNRQFVTSSGHGCMGAGLPMAIGAGLATGKRTVLIDGDGSFQLSLSELGTWAAYYPRLDLHVHILDNGSGGIVSQFARLNGYDARETIWQNPDFKKIASAYDLSLAVHKVGEEGVWPILEAGHWPDMTWPKDGKL